jgi:hypothetical protein
MISCRLALAVHERIFPTFDPSAEPPPLLVGKAAARDEVSLFISRSA